MKVLILTVTVEKMRKEVFLIIMDLIKSQYRCKN